MPSRSGIHQLESLLDRLPDGRVSIGTMLDTLGAGAWGLCFLLFGAVTLVPGVAPLFGVALCAVALGLIAGQERPWLPRRMRDWGAERARLAAGFARLRPGIARLERLLHARGDAFLGGAMLRLAGLAVLVNGVLIVLPIPFGNTAPAVATLIVALSLITRDGFALLAGFAATALALAIDAVLLWVGFQAIVGLLEQAL